MTLQYRIRSKDEDERWRQRIYLCDKLLRDAIDWWCRTDSVFPTYDVVGSVLYLFSPRCDPFELSPYRLVERFGGIIGTPETEYRLAWPRRSTAEADSLIAALAAIVAGAVRTWIERGVGDPSTGEVADRLAEEIVARRYVSFHHRETTRRDVNHWGI
jgi:hypothetical protein